MCVCVWFFCRLSFAVSLTVWMLVYHSVYVGLLFRRSGPNLSHSHLCLLNMHTFGKNMLLRWNSWNKTSFYTWWTLTRKIRKTIFVFCCCLAMMIMICAFKLLNRNGIQLTNLFVLSLLMSIFICVSFFLNRAMDINYAYSTQIWLNQLFSITQDH